MKQIIISLFLFIVIISCKKEGNGYVKGTVYEQGSGILYKGATVYLTMGKTDNQGNKTYTTIDSVYTDNSGKYYLSFKMELRTSYSVQCRPNNFFTDNSVVMPGE